MNQVLTLAFLSEPRLGLGREKKNGSEIVIATSCRAVSPCFQNKLAIVEASANGFTSSKWPALIYVYIIKVAEFCRAGESTPDPITKPISSLSIDRISSPRRATRVSLIFLVTRRCRESDYSGSHSNIWRCHRGREQYIEEGTDNEDSC